jgi:flagellar hook-length control protein FliK
MTCVDVRRGGSQCQVRFLYRLTRWRQVRLGGHCLPPALAEAFAAILASLREMTAGSALPVPVGTDPSPFPMPQSAIPRKAIQAGIASAAFSTLRSGAADKSPKQVESPAKADNDDPAPSEPDDAAVTLPTTDTDHSDAGKTREAGVMDSQVEIAPKPRGGGDLPDVEIWFARPAKSQDKTRSGSGQHALPTAQPPTSQSGPGIMPSTLASPAQGMIATAQVSVSLPILSSDTFIGTKPRATVDSAKNEAESYRSDPTSLATKQLARPDHETAPDSPAIMAWSEAKPEKVDVRAEVASDVTPIVTRSEFVQPPALRTDASPLPQPPQDQSAITPERAAPVEQVAPALVGLLKTTADGTQSVTVRLQPPELGRVQIRIDQTADGAARVDITAEKPETLQLLLRDEPRIQQVLDQAGILSGGRSVNFQVGAPDVVGATASRPDSMSGGSGDLGQGQSGGTWRQDEGSRGDRGPDPDLGQRQPRVRWFRTGLDITA